MMYHPFPSLVLLLLNLLYISAYEVVPCYWTANLELPSGGASPNNYIPCGEVSTGAQACCRVGHFCLEGACYAPEGEFYN
jgi:hypothetical protein